MPKYRSKIPIVRVVARWWYELTRQAPLEDFSHYDGYWHLRERDEKTSRLLDRHKKIAFLIPRNSRVLDIGCGDGVFLEYLAEKRPDCTALGVDIASEAVDRLKARGFNVQLIDPTIDLEGQVPMGWDAVTMMEVIEHVVDSEKMVKEMLSLKPRNIYITIPNAGFILHRLRLMIFGKFPITNIHYHMKEHVRFWTVSDFKYWSKMNGMRLVSYFGQVDRPDLLVNILGKKFPGLFASRIVFHLKPSIIDR